MSSGESLEAKVKLSVQASEATRKYRAKLTITSEDLSLSVILPIDQLEEAIACINELKEKGYVKG
jgi:hypothetical protein